MTDKLIDSIDRAIREISERMKNKLVEIRTKKLEYAYCPKCGKKAKTKEEVEKLFGFRNMDDIVRKQSWCRECR